MSLTTSICEHYEVFHPNGEEEQVEIEVVLTVNYTIHPSYPATWDNPAYGGEIEMDIFDSTGHQIYISDSDTSRIELECEEDAAGNFCCDERDGDDYL